MRILLAPMEGVIDHLMRQTLCNVKPFVPNSDIDICVTEFVRVTDHTLPDKVFYRTCPEILSPSSYPIRIQLLGSNPTALAQNAQKAAGFGVDAVDLNFGCPAKTVNKNRGGACLLDETDLIYEIVAAVRSAVPSAIPVTVKIRLGYQDRNTYMDNAHAIEKAGANELIVHARSKADGYAPPAYWECIGEIRRSLHIPVIANGEIWSVADYLTCRIQSGCEDIMLGRGLLAQPDLAYAIKAHMRDEPYTPMSWQQLVPILIHFFEATASTYPEKYLGNRLKQWLHYLQRHFPQAEAVFHQIKRSRNSGEISSALQRSTNMPE